MEIFFYLLVFLPIRLTQFVCLLIIHYIAEMYIRMIGSSGRTICAERTSVVNHQPMRGIGSRSVCVPYLASALSDLIVMI